MTTYKVGYFVGSLAKDSINRKLSKALVNLAPPGLKQSLRGVLCFCNSPLMNTVEAYIHFTPGLISDDGQVTNDATTKFLRNYMLEFHAFIVRVEKALSPNA